MQQTNQYQLNLIESGDTFSAAPLNENAETVAAVLANHEETLAEHTEAIAAGVKCTTGSYTGNGKYGSSNPNSLTFDFEPKLVVVMGDTRWALFLHKSPRSLGRDNDPVSYDRLIQTVTWSGNTLSWYASTMNSDSGPYTVGEETQLNLDGVKYYYLAIG